MTASSFERAPSLSTAEASHARTTGSDVPVTSATWGGIEAARREDQDTAFLHHKWQRPVCQ